MHKEDGIAEFLRAEIKAQRSENWKQSCLVGTVGNDLWKDRLGPHHKALGMRNK